MLSERPWKADAVVKLLAALLIGLFITSLISWGAQQLSPGKTILGNRFIQFVLNTLTFQILALILIRRFLGYHQVGWGELFGLHKTHWKTIAGAVLVALVALPVALTLNNLCAALLTKVRVEPVTQEPMQVLQITVSTSQRIIFAIEAIILAPIVEETLFRGILYPTIKQEGFPRFALFGSSLLFAAIHLNLMTFIPLFVLALILVLLMEITDTLLAPIIAHSCFNAANFFIYLNSVEITNWWNELVRSLKHAVSM